MLSSAAGVCLGVAPSRSPPVSEALDSGDGRFSPAPVAQDLGGWAGSPSVVVYEQDVGSWVVGPLPQRERF